MPYTWPKWKAEHPHEERIARRFRHHVRTPSNPRGRIHREPCCLCGLEPYELDAEGRPLFGCCRVQAHHPDHERPFLVAWLCDEHHRDVEDGKRRLLKRHLWDYTSLVAPITKPGLHRNGRAGRRLRLVGGTDVDRSTNEVPF